MKINILEKSTEHLPVFVVAGDDGMLEDDSVGSDDVSVVGFDVITVVADCVSVALVDSMSALLSVFLYQLKKIHKSKI